MRSRGGRGRPWRVQRTLTCARVSVGTLTHRPLPRVELDRAGELVRNGDAIVVAGLTALAAFLRFWRLGHQGFWFDEGNTALLVHFTPGQMLGLIPQTESTPPLYYCVAWVWARIFGFGEAGLRSLSALAGVLTVPVAYGAARKLISGRAGLIAAALTACNPFLIWYSQEARSYELLVLLTSVSLLALAYAQAKPTPRTVTLWVLAAALALATHYYALLAIVPQALWLLLTRRRVRAVQVGLAVVALCGLALIPLAISQNATGHASWIAPIQLQARLDQLIPHFLIGFQAPAQSLLLHIAEAVVVLALLILAVAADRHERRASLALGALAVGGLALNLLLIAIGVDDLITRNVIALLMPALVMVAGGLAVRRAGLFGIAAATVLCATGVVAAVGVATDRGFQRPDWRVVARILGPRPRPGVADRAILVQNYRDLLPLSLYVPGLKFWRGYGAQTVSELDVVSFTAPRVHLCWWGAACNLSPSAMQRSYPIPGFHEVWRRRALQFTVMRLEASRPVTLTPWEVAIVLNKTKYQNDELLVQRPR